MTPATGAQIQPPFLPRRSVEENQYLDRLVGSILSGRPTDILVQICKAILTAPTERPHATGSKSFVSRVVRCVNIVQKPTSNQNEILQPFENLSSFFRTCHAMNTGLRKNFFSGCEEDIDARLQGYTLHYVRAAIAKIYGTETPPPRIVDRLGTLMVHSGRVSVPRFFCKQLTISLSDPWPFSELWGTQRWFQSIIPAYPPFLDELKIVDVGMTDALLDEAITKCPQLTKLHLVSCNRISFSGTAVWESLTSLTTFDCLDLKHNRCLKNIAKRCPNLTTLSMDWISMDQAGITGNGLCALASGCSHLKFLQLDGCSGVDGAALFTLAEQCPSLTRIVLEGQKLPSLHDCVLLLLAFPAICDLVMVRRDKWDDLTFTSIHVSIEAYLGSTSPQHLVNVAWACAVLGLDDRYFVDRLIKHVCLNRTRLVGEEMTKMYRVCKKFDRMACEELFFSPDRERALSAQDSPEKRQAEREKAAEVLMEFLGEFRSWLW